MDSGMVQTSMNTCISPWLTTNKDMGERSKFPKSSTFETPFLKFAVCPLYSHSFKFNGQMSFDRLKINQRSYYGLLNSAF